MNDETREKRTAIKGELLSRGADENTAVAKSITEKKLDRIVNRNGIGPGTVKAWFKETRALAEMKGELSTFIAKQLISVEKHKLELGSKIAKNRHQVAYGEQLHEAQLKLNESASDLEQRLHVQTAESITSLSESNERSIQSLQEKVDNQKITEADAARHSALFRAMAEASERNQAERFVRTIESNNSRINKIYEEGD